MDEFLSGEAHCSELVKKLSRANGMLAKVRHYIPQPELKNVYHAIFESHILYGSQVWTPKLLSVTNTISVLQKNAMRIITFSEFKAHSEPLFKKLQVLKFTDSIALNNCLFVYDFLNGNLPDSYTGTFSRIQDSDQNYPTRQARTGLLKAPKYNSTAFGLKCIYKNCINSWNKYSTMVNTASKLKQNTANKFKHVDVDMLKFSRNQLKETISKIILSNYCN